MSNTCDDIDSASVPPTLRGEFKRLRESDPERAAKMAEVSRQHPLRAFAGRLSELPQTIADVAAAKIGDAHREYQGALIASTDEQVHEQAREAYDAAQADALAARDLAFERIEADSKAVIDAEKRQVLSADPARISQWKQRMTNLPPHELAEVAAVAVEGEHKHEFCAAAMDLLRETVVSGVLHGRSAGVLSVAVDAAQPSAVKHAQKVLDSISQARRRHLYEGTYD